MKYRALVLLLVWPAFIVACDFRGGRSETPYPVSTGGNAQQGAAIIAEVGCGSCHTIPGIRGAAGVVGPPLNFFSRRTYIAGRIPNTPENLTIWVLDPQSVDPQTAMPDLGLTETQAHDVVAYLYTLR